MITLPNFTEVKNLSLGLTDYAVATGAIACETVRHPNGTIERWGDGWLRNASYEFASMQTYRWSSQGVHNFSHRANAAWVAVAPRFQNPADDGWGCTTIAKRQYLTLNGALTYYPQQQVSQRLGAELSRALQHQQPKLARVGEVTGPYYYEKDFQAIQSQVHERYQYKGQNYVRFLNKEAPATWYRCDPIPVQQEPDGSLQCTKMLFASPFDDHLKNFLYQKQHNKPEVEVNVADFALGCYLQQDFRQDLIASANQIQPTKLCRFNLITFLQGLRHTTSEQCLKK